ncbi:MAG: hypothetical protein GVY19_01290 [Bacteroidetes bacterium]|jgi:rare lipoprotein A|nr:hypothetical protein [Bacteroidota bacterium]
MFKLLPVLLLLFSLRCGFAQIMYEETGQAVKLKKELTNQVTHSGLAYQPGSMTASHFTLPFGSVMRVTNTENNQEIVVKVIHRGPFTQNAIIGLSDSAWTALNMDNQTSVRVEYLGHDKIEAPEKYVEPYFFLLDAKQIIPKGYGVQIGSYTEKSNLLKAADDARNQVNEKVIIQVLKEHDYKYRILIGDFTDKSEADKLKGHIEEIFPDCFVVGYFSL